MPEIITAYNLSNLEIAVPMTRDIFYEEQAALSRTGKKPTYAVGVVNIFLFNSQGEMLVQKRSFDKNHNPGLLDKSIGGHIPSGDFPDYTTMIETIQELQTPSIVLKNEEDFLKTLSILRKYLETVAVVEHIDTRLFTLPKIIKGEKIDIANLSSIYFGIYNGRIRPVDREAKGVLWYSLTELKTEMAKIPEAFTSDLHLYVTHYKENLEQFVKAIKEKQ